MSSNLANVYANLLRKYGESYTLTYSPPPSYLTNIVGSSNTDKKIVLFYISKLSEKHQATVTPSKLNFNKTEPDLDLTGSPLKDDCIVDAIADLSLDIQIENLHPWSIDEEFHRGIPIDKARTIICTEDFHRGANTDSDIGSVWFLCNASNTQRNILLQYEFTARHFCRGTISFAGVIPANNVNTQTLLKIHNELISVGTPIETYIENTYKIKSNISLRCAWWSNAMLPTLVDLTSCDVTLTQTYRANDCSALTEDFMNQLRILMYIRDDIIDYRKAERKEIPKEAVYRCGRGIDMNELRDQINKVMTEVSGFTDTDNSNNGGAEFDIEDVVQRASVRRLADLTDKLWEILRCCSSYKDLKMAFNILFQCAVRHTIVNPPTNKNRLAEIITELGNRRLAMPCLTGVEPLELLLEIGLEKLYKDYEYIYSESKVCSANLLRNSSSSTDAYNAKVQSLPKVRKSLYNAVCPEQTPSMRKTLLHHASSTVQENSLMDFKNSHFDEQDTATKIAKLLQIHCTLEHLLLIHRNLNLSGVYRDVCAQLLQRPLRFVDAIDDTLCDVIDISVSVHQVAVLLQGKEPHARRIIMKSSHKFSNVMTTFYFNMENVCPPHMLESFQCDDKEMVKEQTYYSWIYRKISTPKIGC